MFTYHPWIFFIINSLISCPMDSEFHNVIRIIMDIYWPRPKIWTPYTGAMNFTILVEDFMDTITIHLVFSYMCESREEFPRFFQMFGPVHEAPGLVKYIFPLNLELL